MCYVLQLDLLYTKVTKEVTGPIIKYDLLMSRYDKGTHMYTYTYTIHKVIFCRRGRFARGEFPHKTIL